MSYFIFVSLMIVLAAIAYVWYVTRYANRIPKNQRIQLHTPDNKILTNWYNLHIKPLFTFSDQYEIAQRYLLQIHNMEVDKNLLVLSEDIPYLGKNVATQNDVIIDLRSELGISGYISVIHSDRLRKELRKTCNYDATMLTDIVDNNLHITAQSHIKDILKFRWEKILELNDSDVLNCEGSYLYVKDRDNGILNQVHGQVMDKYHTYPMSIRMNMLCSNYEFEELITRWKELLQNKPLMVDGNKNGLLKMAF